MEWIWLGAVLAAAYLIGSVSTAILVGRLVSGDDIRKHGSGNAGATNALRTYGKKAAALVGEKSLEMLHVKDLLAVTGYIRGGCTALGMKKQFPTVVEQSLREKPFIFVSGGKRGLQLKLAPGDLAKAANAQWGDVLAKD